MTGKASEMIALDHAEILTGYILNTSLYGYRHVNLVYDSERESDFRHVIPFTNKYE
jgi:hypothetical protein